MATPSELLTALEKLEAAGMTVEQLRSLHHSAGTKNAAQVTFGSVRRYFEQGHPLRFSNQRFADRLIHAAEGLPASISTRVKDALNRYPF